MESGKRESVFAGSAEAREVQGGQNETLLYKIVWI